MDLSFQFVMDLYRAKCAAESRGDTTALTSLAHQYPELFAEDFKEFIDALKEALKFLNHKYGENYSFISTSKGPVTVRTLN